FHAAMHLGGGWRATAVGHGGRCVARPTGTGPRPRATSGPLPGGLVLSVARKICRTPADRDSRGRVLPTARRARPFPPPAEGEHPPESGTPFRSASDCYQRRRPSPLPPADRPRVDVRPAGITPARLDPTLQRPSISDHRNGEKWDRPA